MLSLRSTVQIKYWIALFTGVLFAILVWEIMTLQFRYVMAISVGIVMISVAIIAIRNIETFIIYALIFNIPLTRLGKYFFHQGQPYSIAVGIALGLAEVLLVMAYVVWFSQIFIARTKPIPKLQKIDYFIILLLLTQAISFIGAPNKALGIFDIVYNIKHILLYFFIAHKVKRHHLKWIITIFVLAILLESSLACYERLTGNVGIGMRKGDVTYSDFGKQYKVLGITHVIRAEGTTKDSHSLGLYYAMLLPIPYIFMSVRTLKMPIRIVLAGILVAGTTGLVVTFSRSGWLSFAISSILATGIIVFLWGRRSAILIPIVSVLIISILYPQGFQHIYDRLVNAPPDILEKRWEMNRTALDIWRSSFLFGYGPGNYTCALEDPDTTVTEIGVIDVGAVSKRQDIPVHNAFLYVAAELGLFGIIAFFGIIFVAMAQCLKLLKCQDPIIRGMSLVVLTGLTAYLLDGITDPMFREAVPYAHLWVYLGLVIAFKRLVNERNTLVEEECCTGGSKTSFITLKENGYEL